jgi:hypothetical protein
MIIMIAMANIFILPSLPTAVVHLYISILLCKVFKHHQHFKSLRQLVHSSTVFLPDRLLKIYIRVCQNLVPNAMVFAHRLEFVIHEFRLLCGDGLNLQRKRQVCRYYTLEDTVADVYIFPVIEAKTEEELPGWIDGGLMYNDTAQM